MPDSDVSQRPRAPTTGHAIRVAGVSRFFLGFSGVWHHPGGVWHHPGGHHPGGAPPGGTTRGRTSPADDDVGAHFLRDLETLLVKMHRSSADFFRPVQGDRKRLVPESVFAALISDN